MFSTIYPPHVALKSFVFFPFFSSDAVFNPRAIALFDVRSVYRPSVREDKSLFPPFWYHQEFFFSASSHNRQFDILFFSRAFLLGSPLRLVRGLCPLPFRSISRGRSSPFLAFLSLSASFLLILSLLTLLLFRSSLIVPPHLSIAPGFAALLTLHKLFTPPSRPIASIFRLLFDFLFSSFSQVLGLAQFCKLPFFFYSPESRWSPNALGALVLCSDIFFAPFFLNFAPPSLSFSPARRAVLFPFSFDCNTTISLFDFLCIGADGRHLPFVASPGVP